jgi:hypothetical protein
MQTPKKPRNRFVVPMVKRYRTTRLRDRRNRRAKDARKSWRRDWGVD